MGIIDKVKSTIHDTASLARDGIDEMQTGRELDQAFGDLGRRTVGLMDAGKLTAPELDFDVDRIRALRTELAGEAPAAPAAG